MSVTENSTPVSTNRIAARHDGCSGEYVHDERAPAVTRTPLGAGPLSYRHICSACRDHIWLPKAYPRVEYAPLPPGSGTASGSTDED